MGPAPPRPAAPGPRLPVYRAWSGQVPWQYPPRTAGRRAGNVAGRTAHRHAQPERAEGPATCRQGARRRKVRPGGAAACGGRPPIQGGGPSLEAVWWVRCAPGPAVAKSGSNTPRPARCTAQHRVILKPKARVPRPVSTWPRTGSRCIPPAAASTASRVPFRGREPAVGMHVHPVRRHRATQSDVL